MGPMSTRSILKFGPFEVDPSLGELRKDGVRIPIQEKPLRVLTALLERQGDLVTRAELHQHLWQGETFVDFDTGLNTAVRKLRSALGDESDSPRYIETLPKRGYRFLAPVEFVNGAVDTDNGLPGVVSAPPATHSAKNGAIGSPESAAGIRFFRHPSLAGPCRSSGRGDADHRERSGRVAYLQPACLLLQLARFGPDCRF